MKKPRQFAYVAALMFAFLTSCGGGGESSGSSGQEPSQGANPAPIPAPFPGLDPSPFPNPDTGIPAPGVDLQPIPELDPDQPFTAQVSIAPKEEATLNGIVRLAIEGSNIRNAELLPATGYIPKYGQFTVTSDGTRAVLDFDTTTLPDGPVTMRISAFDQRVGDSAAKEIIAMPPRNWTIQNTPVFPQ